MTTYYVNYAAGADTNSGTSATTPWKHAPGDSNATGNVANVGLVGGDEVLFKAGVVYQGSISPRSSGSAGKPIVYEGTGWGTGQATVSGLTSVTLNFTQDPTNPNRSVATLPANLVPKGYATTPLSAIDNILQIDGNVSWMTNNSLSSSANFPDVSQIPLSPSQITGSGTSWTITDSTLAGLVSALAPIGLRVGKDRIRA